jgi:flagellar hook-basal body complex protein FliE
MVDIRIGGDFIPPPSASEKPGPGGQRGATSFNAVLKNTMNDINALQLKADQAIEKVELDSSASIHEAMIALEKADISFKAMMQVRNKIIEAYQEVMRMQV